MSRVLPRVRVPALMLALGPVLALSLGLTGCRETPPPPPTPSGTPVPDADSGIKVVNLDQGWNEQTQLAFWFTSQGSRIVPYKWFLVLEQAANQTPFRDNANMRRFGYLPAKAGPGTWNPDGLPIGFVKAPDTGQGEWMGVTCAACHTTQINYKGVGLRIDGGPTIADFNTLYEELVASLSATLSDSAKFDRFAVNVLGGSPMQPQKDQLKQQLTQVHAQSDARNKVNKPTHEPGPARLDAFGAIFNQVLVAALNQPANGKPPDAPVSYPFLWDTPQHNVVQWNGSAPNGPFGIGELARNTGEVVGVFGGLTIDNCGADTCKYPNTIDIEALGSLEAWVRGLWSPQWNPNYLGAPDAAKVTEGQALYKQECVQCHALIDRTNPKRKITAVMRNVGTDPAMATAALTRTGTTGALDGRIKSLLPPPPTRFGATDTAGAMLDNAVVGVMLGNFAATVRAIRRQHGPTSVGASGALEAPQEPPPTEDQIRDALQRQPADRAQIRQTRFAAFKVVPGTEAAAAVTDATYKARPLNGIWATAPYLHNGSVPNLWELLQDPTKRAKTFLVGSREYDPVNVGLETTTGTYTLDTSLPGNSNSGHAFGTTLTDAQKRALIEYLKTL